MAGRTTIGGFVLVNTMLVQLSMPLNFMGMIYREIKQALIDIDDMFRILHQNPEIADRPGAAPLVAGSAAVRFENVHFAYIPERPILKGISFEVPPGRMLAIGTPREVRDRVGLAEVEPARLRRDRVRHRADLRGQRTELAPGDLLVAGIARGEGGAVGGADRLSVRRGVFPQGGRGERTGTVGHRR